MCGRFTLTAKPEVVREALDLGQLPAEMEPRYNIAPTQPVAVVTEPETRDVELFRWGLVPSWAKEPSIGSTLINARVETVAEKPAFRAAFARRRCLVLADGFFEWEKRTKKEGGSRPFYFRLSDGEPFAFAGLWEVWRDPASDGDKLLTCTLLTGAANERVAPIHARTPIILQGEKLWRWLDPDASPEELRTLLAPFPAERMVGYAVSPAVNRPQYDGPECVQPVGE